QDGALGSDRFFDEPVASRAMNLIPLELYLESGERRTPLLLPESAETMEVKITLPSGMSVIDAPESFEKKTPFGRFAQKFGFDSKTRTLSLSRIDQTEMVRISPREFPAFREVVQEIALRTRNRLILSRGQ